MDRRYAAQRAVVDAFFAAAHAATSMRSSRSSIRTSVLHGAAAAAGQTLQVAQPTALKRPVLVHGAAGVGIAVEGRPISVVGFTVAGGKIVEIDAVVDPEHLSRLDLSVLDD